MSAANQPAPDFAAEAVLACFEGRATQRQQRSVAAQLALASNAKGGLAQALKRCARRVQIDAGFGSPEYQMARKALVDAGELQA